MKNVVSALKVRFVAVTIPLAIVTAVGLMAWGIFSFTSQLRADSAEFAAQCTAKGGTVSYGYTGPKAAMSGSIVVSPTCVPKSKSP